jgi:hypothetical protein
MFSDGPEKPPPSSRGATPIVVAFVNNAARRMRAGSASTGVVSVVATVFFCRRLILRRLRAFGHPARCGCEPDALWARRGTG